MLMKYPTVQGAMGRVRQLERELSLPKGGCYLNIKHANQRVAELEALAARQAPAAPATTTTPTAAAMATAAATAPAPRSPSRKQLEAIVGICSPLASKEIRATWTDDELMLEAERAAYQAYVTFPGRRSDAELSAEFWRKHANANELTGVDRVFRADRQVAVNQILKGK
jgi:hypothetical protein